MGVEVWFALDSSLGRAGLELVWGFIAFRGPATKLVQKDQKQIKADDREYAAKIAEKVNALRSADGITSIEQCAVAVRLASTKPEDVIPGVKLVGNGWISLMAYQAKGYGYIAP